MSQVNFKELFPKRLTEFEKDNGLITVLFKKEKPSIIEKLFFKSLLDKPYKIDLDEIGTYVWEQCNGDKSISQISELAKQHFGEKIEPCNERIELFIKQLNKNKLVGLFEKVE